MENKLGVYDGDPCPNCGQPRKRGELCPRCRTSIVRVGVGTPDIVPLTRARLQISPQRHPHVCGIPTNGHGHCVHCDADYICQRCGHSGMQTKDMKPPYFILRCPVCKWENPIHWIEYDLPCPRCGNPHTFGTYTKSFERIIQCPDCGVMPRGEAA